MSNVFPPGSTIGILGGGQLGRMLAFVAKRMGYRVVVFSDIPDSPAEQVSDEAVVGDYQDEALLASFREKCDVITYEFENIPIQTCRALEEHRPVRPNPDAIYYAQHRARERGLLTELQIPVAPFQHLKEEGDIQSIPDDFVFPAILKTASFGYDGKGQVSVDSREQLLSGWETLSRTECILEQRISFDKEFSIIVARNQTGECVTYGPIENHHERHILDVSVCPGNIPQTAGEQAISHAKKIAEKLDVQGVITIEYFLTTAGDVLVNEIAPRPHNSGHLTIEGCVTSQFEQQLRGVCGLPLGSEALRSPVAMVNLLGDLWGEAEALDALPAFSGSDTHIHLYGKSAPRPGRKMGHLTVVAGDVATAKEQALQIRAELKR